MTQHTFHPLTLDPRSAGKTTRFHTWERIRDQSVGEHSWQNIRILLAIWPAVPRHVLVHAMYHDLGERVTGDMPYPVKAERPVLKQIMDELEDCALDAMVEWGVQRDEPLAPVERSVFKLAEFLEMWEFALDEIALGNRNCRLIEERCFAQACKLANEELLPPGVRDHTSTYMQRRIKHERDHRSR